MCKRFCFITIYAVVILLQAGIVLADHDMTCHPSSGGNFARKSVSLVMYNIQSVGEELNLIVPGAGGATSSSCSSAGGDTLPVVLLPDSISAIEHVRVEPRSALFSTLTNVNEAFLDDHVGLSAELPNFIKPNGTPLLAQYSETGLVFLLQAARDFETGESLSASGGQIFAWPAVTLREMPADFDLDELFPPDPARFPLYTGPAQVADVAIYTVVPEPASWLLLLGGAMAIAGRRRSSRRA
jgi:hypothetical protein